MTRNKLRKIRALSIESQDYLKRQLIYKLQYKSFRQLEKITLLNSKQLQRIINENKFPHFESVLKAIQGLLNNPNNLSVKKRRE